MILNTKQKQIVSDGLHFIRHSSKQIFQYGGLAGTGKSVVLFEIMNNSGIPLSRIAPMSFIGQAAIIMRSKGLLNAKTIHSWLFVPEIQPLYDSSGKPIIDPYYGHQKVGIKFIPRDLEDIDLLIIDEGYTTPMNLKEEIESRGKKIIVTGDPGQLPPVKDKPAYLTGDFPILDEIMRQDKNSNIVYIADRARRGLPISRGFYKNVLVIDEDELTDDMLMNSSVLICSKNKTRDFYNNKIRKLRGHKGSLPEFGEKIICRKNNWLIDVNGISLANGLVGRVTRETNPLEFDGKTFNIDFLPDMFPYPFCNLVCDYEYFTASYDKKAALKTSAYNTAEKFDFANAITTHLSQGAQFPYGIYIEEYMGKDIQNNLNYTGITRFINGLIYVKKRPKTYYNTW